MDVRSPGYDQWLAGNVRNGGSGSSNDMPSSLSHSPEPVVSQAQFAILIDALMEQTAAIGRLIRSNEALMLAMAQVDQEPDSDAPQTHYLSGKRI